MAAKRGRVYRRHIRQMLPVVTVVTAAWTVLMLGLSARWPALGLLLGAIFLYVAADLLILLGNQRLRRKMAVRLADDGEAVDARTERFVGLSHPSQLYSPRRLIESDDDVGFLRLTAEALVYRGDAEEFTVPWAAVSEVHLVRSPAAPWRRVQVTVRSGESFQRVIFDSRHGRSHTVCRLDNGLLAREIQRLMAAAPPAARLTGSAAAEELHEPLRQPSS